MLAPAVPCRQRRHTELPGPGARSGLPGSRATTEVRLPAGAGSSLASRDFLLRTEATPESRIPDPGGKRKGNPPLGAARGTLLPVADLGPHAPFFPAHLASS